VLSSAQTAAASRSCAPVTRRRTLRRRRHASHTERNVKADELELPDIRGLAVAPEGAHAVVLAKRLVLCLDGGKVLARLTDFASPRDVVFE